MKIQNEVKDVMYEDAPVEYRKNIEGWISPDGRFFGKGETGEHQARWYTCTHMKCACGSKMSKSYTKCTTCRSHASSARYIALPFQEWDGKTPLCIWGNDDFFWDSDDLWQYCEDNEVKSEDLELVLAHKGSISEVDIDSLNDEYCTEDESLSDFHPEIAEKVEELNALIRKTEPKIWYGSRIRTTVKL